MLLFFRNIPEHTRHRDLIQFIEPAMKGLWFSKKGILENVKVIQQKDSRTKIPEFHGLVLIKPDAVAIRVIKRLHRKSFLGKHIIVREYHIRDWHNDPRLKFRPDNSSLRNKRIVDRRRQHLEVVKDVAHKFSALESFHREY